jgi:hypothetical protein
MKELGKEGKSPRSVFNKNHYSYYMGNEHRSARKEEMQRSENYKLLEAQNIYLSPNQS